MPSQPLTPMLGVLLLGLEFSAAAQPLAQPPAAALDSELNFPEGVEISRSLTPAEAAYLSRHPDYFTGQAGPFDGRVGGVRPPGPILCPGEYEPVQALLVAWEGNTAQNTILRQMIAQITTTGNADAYVVVDTASEQTTVAANLVGSGADFARVKYFVRTTDTIWIRDYGPRFIYAGQRGVPGQGAVRGIVDHTYNRPRANDDAFSPWFGPNGFGGQRRHPVFDLGLIHGGGNYHLSSLGDSYATQLIANENPSLSTATIQQTWRDFQNVDTTITSAFPTSVDSTQHIDMWMQIIGDRRVIISDWPLNPGSTQDVICDNTAAFLQSRGYTVFRMPARLVSGVHYTYANMVLCNNLVLLPTYTNSSMSSGSPSYNAQALTAAQQAFDFNNDGTPDRTIVQVPCDALATSAGVMHCIVMHVPAHLGAAGVNGQAPTALLTAPNGLDPTLNAVPQTLTPGQSFTLSWLTDDDKNIASVDLQFSANGGVTFPLTIAAGLADSGSRSWVVPNIPTTHARVRVVARDADGNIGGDMSDFDFVIAGTPCPSDLNLDGYVDDGDFTLFAAAYDNFTDAAGDLNGDGYTDDADFVIFATAYDAFTCP